MVIMLDLLLVEFEDARAVRPYDVIGGFTVG